MEPKPLRLIFMGTPGFAVPALQTLIDSEHELAAVYCQPPRPAGRGKKETPSPVQVLAETHGIEVRHPTSLKNDAEADAFRALGADAAVVIAYGLLLPPSILEACPMGCINVHPSKLPRWRGAAPIQRTLLAGDTDTSLITMQMDEGLDTGDMLLSLDYDIDANSTAGELHDLLANEAGPLVLATLAGLSADELTPIAQPESGVTYADKIAKDERPIDWSLSAEGIHHHICGLSPYPAATFDVHGETIKVLASENIGTLSFARAGTVLSDRLAVACGDGRVLRLTKLQRAGKKPMSAEELMRGFKLAKGDRLS